MKIAIAGLGRMGSQIAQKLAEDKHEVIAHNRSPEPVKQAEKHGAVAAYSKQDVIKAFGGEQIIAWLMIPQEVLEAEIKDWLKLAGKGSLFIDGGNSDFRQTKKHAA